MVIFIGNCNRYQANQMNTLATVKNVEAVAQRCSVKNVFLVIPQNSRESTCARVSILIKLQGSDLQLY